MKRMISLLLAASLIVCTFPLSSQATTMLTEQTTARDELIQSACEAFPEFESKIVNSSAAAKMTPDGQEKHYEVYCETRSVSENKKIQYREYSDGVILLSAVECNDVDITVNSRDGSSFATNYDVTLEATMTGVQGYFRLSNVKFSLRNSQYDMITSLGTPTRSGNCTDYSLALPSLGIVPVYESAAGDAKILYDVWFQAGGPYFTKWTQLTFYVGHNTFSCDFVDLDS